MSTDLELTRITKRLELRGETELALAMARSSGKEAGISRRITLSNLKTRYAKEKDKVRKAGIMDKIKQLEEDEQEGVD